MGKKTTSHVFFAAFVLLAMFAIFGCISLPGGGQVVINDTETIPPIINDTGQVVINATGGCENLLDPHMRDNCYFNIVSKGQDEGMATCYKIKDNRLRDRCAYLLGVKKMELCPQISDSSIDLRDDCFYANAESSGKESVCFRIRNMTLLSKCKAVVAAKTCAGKGEYDNAVCLAYALKDPNYCGLIANKSQDCYFEIAKNFSDSSICKKIDNAIRSKACEAIISGNLNLCNQLQYNTSSDVCYQTVAINWNNASICDLTVVETYINSCHETLAIMNNQPDLCRHLLSEPARDQCYKDVALKYRDPATCGLIKEIGSRDLCRHSIAIDAVRPYFCGFIENDYMRGYQCYNELLSGKYNLTLDVCKEIRNEDLDRKDSCFLAIEERTGNSSICELITSSAIKSRCR